MFGPILLILLIFIPDLFELFNNHMFLELEVNYSSNLPDYSEYEDINLFSNQGNNDHPDNFMDFSSSSFSENLIKDSNKEESNKIISPQQGGNSNEIGSEKEESKYHGQDIRYAKTGKVSSDLLPQTEFQKTPYTDYKVLPKSDSAPNNLGKK